MRKLEWLSAGIWISVLAGSGGAQECTAGAQRFRGQVLDGSDAAILGAEVRGAEVRGAHGLVLRTDSAGRFQTGCEAGSPELTVVAKGFEQLTIQADFAQPMLIHLSPRTVVAEVDAVDATGVSSEDLAGSRTLTQADLKDMADDPDELARQLQVLAAAAGGAPGAAVIAVDGFQNGGRIPPKSSIAFIRVNPDLFSAEYERPPYQGGRIEIYTKPGQDRFHGALFTTQSAGLGNAADPFAPSRAAIGKQRYGFELSGPVKRTRSDFAVALEHRQIDQFAVIDAVTLDSLGSQTTTVANVPTPQTLWQGSARFGAMLTPKNNANVTYTATVNSLANLGVGGTALQEAGFNSVQSEHVVRLTNLQTVSAHLLHESRLGYTWRSRSDTPASTAASLQVAGSFTGGGAETQAMHTREHDLELDDDVLLSAGKHNLKAGMELLDAAFNNQQPTNFNGSFVFGGGAAPLLNGSGSTIISGLEQYRRALLGLPGGSPTTFSVTSGEAQVQLNQLRVVLYAQDQWKLKPRLQLTGGLRWSVQNAPTTVGNLGPRLGLAWSPDRAQKWVLHLRSGLFFSPVDPLTALEAHRLDGRTQLQSLVYSPAFYQPLTSGSAVITSLRAPLVNVGQTPSLQSHVGVEHDFPRHWHVQGNLYLVRAWDVLRSANINAPANGLPTGPRPLLPDQDLAQYQQSGSVHGNVLFLGVDQHSLRRLQLFAGYIRMDLRGNADSDNLFPQTTASDAGETARPAWETTHHGIVFSTLHLPRQVSLTTQFDAASGVPYNVTTGFDNNGDGILNDRPYLASAPGANTVATRFGLLSPTGTGATLGRNTGTLPWNVHLDLNLSRSFAMTHPAQGEPRTLAVNLRSTNALNHTNVTAVGGVLGSPLFGLPYAAGPGRRIELGLRYSF